MLSADGTALADATWGRRNTLAIRHPLSGAIPFSGSWLDMPAGAVNFAGCKCAFF